MIDRGAWDAFPSAGYPALYRAASAAAESGRRAHTALVTVELLLLVLGTALGTAAAFDQRFLVVLPMLAAASFIAAAVLKVVARDRRYDRLWLDGRAIAQTVRSAAWRYMMRTPPYEDADTADAAFVDALRSALDSRPGTVASFASPDGGTRQITPEMRAERARPLRERVARYRAARVADQVAWYGRKGRRHARRAASFFWLALAAQVGAIGAAALMLADPELAKYNLLGVLAVIATTLTAIAQLNRHDELGRAYGYAQQELSLIDGLAETADTEADLRRVVDDAEGAIAREHKVWLANGRSGR